MMAQAQSQTMDTYTVALNKGDGLYGLYARTWRNSFGTPLKGEPGSSDVKAKLGLSSRYLTRHVLA